METSPFDDVDISILLEDPDKHRLQRNQAETDSDVRLTPTGREQKPCPGLGGVPCGRAKNKSDGYCKDCRRVYQRSRYEKIKNDQQETYVPRTNVRRATTSCGCCGTEKTDEFTSFKTQTDQTVLVCDNCWGSIYKLNNEFGPELFKRIAQFAIAHPELFRRSRQSIPTPPVANGRVVSVEEALEYEKVVRIRRFAEDPVNKIRGDYELATDILGGEEQVLANLRRAYESGNLQLRSRLSEEEAPWLFVD